MIRKIRIIDSNYSGLEKKFPEELELDLDLITLLVGPNGSGKTALMRMLATSIWNGKFFRKRGYSKKACSEEELGKGSSTMMGYAEGGIDKIDSLIKFTHKAKQTCEGYELPSLIRGELQKIPLLNEFFREREIDLKQRVNRRTRYLNYIKEWVSYVKGKGYDPDEIFNAFRGAKLLEYGERAVDAVLRSGGDKEIKKRPDNSGYDFFEDMVDLVLRNHKPLELRETYWTVDSETFGHISDWVKLISQENDSNRWVYVKPFLTGIRGEIVIGEFAIPEPDKSPFLRDNHSYSEFKPRNFCRTKKSPGLDLVNKIYSFFQRVDLLLTKGQKKTYDIRGNEGYEKIADPEKDGLLVVMDEPTIFFDYKNKRLFKDKIVKATEKYNGRIQFLIPTNDPLLIDGLEGRCKYIDLYQTPAKSTDKLSLREN